jgi:hypothetical protein
MLAQRLRSADRIAVRCVVLLLSALALNSCSSMKRHAGPSAAVTGAVVGTAAYAACKLAGGSDRKCAVIAGGTAVLGGVVTYVALRQIASREEAAARHAGLQLSGATGYVERVVCIPEGVTAGARVALRSQWTVLAPDDGASVPYREQWDIRKEGGEGTRVLDQRSGVADQGTYESGVEFVIPPDWPSGRYLAMYRLSVGGTEQTKDGRLSVDRRRLGTP